MCFNTPSISRLRGFVGFGLFFCAGLGTGWWLSGQRVVAPDRLTSQSLDVRSLPLPESWVQAKGPAVALRPLEYSLRPARGILADLCCQIEAASLDDIPALLAQLQRPEYRRFRGICLDLLVQRWAQIEPAGALAYVMGCAPTERHALISAVFVSWVVGDAEAACTAFEKLEPNGVREAAFKGLVSGWVSADPTEAVAYLSAVSDRDLSRSAPAELVETLWSHGPVATAAFLATLKTGELKIGAFRHLARNWAEQEPAAAAQWAARLGEAPHAVAALREIAHTWSAATPTAAASWAGSLPSGVQRKAAIAEVVGVWATVAPAAAAEWVGGLDGSESYDLAATQFIERIASIFPQAAESWALTLSDEASRAGLVSKSPEHGNHHQPEAGDPL